MKKSMRARRLARHHRRLGGASKLNLVSLMDIFTILVFFLMVNSSEVQVLQSNKTIKLPDSVAEQKPEETLVIMVNQESLVVQGRPIAQTADVMAGTENLIPALHEELKYQAQRRPELSDTEKQLGRPVTIMGDASIPYELLKKVMATCADTDFRNISLAVNRKFASEDADAAAEEGEG
ncbi:ExbD/TolR family protein [Corallincola platygyrae]|uniref:ExbD/TolR family protein n=1 Tax=Corallincola platygyrae TaxID=1193278 RepID=A0ABW4XT16_9GAMM